MAVAAQCGVEGEGGVIQHMRSSALWLGSVARPLSLQAPPPHTPMPITRPDESSTGPPLMPLFMAERHGEKRGQAGSEHTLWHACPPHPPAAAGAGPAPASV